MDLKIEKLKLSNFRNYDSFLLEDVGTLTVFIGDNGVGKTNILEGINLLTSCETLRHAQINQLVKENCTAARLEACFTDGNRSIDITLDLEPGKKKYQVNGKAKSITDVKGTLPAVSFTPDDLELAKKSSSVKRNALDALGMQLSKSYHVVYRDFEKALRYKNRLLKEEAAPTLVESINDTLVICASQLYCYRVSLFKRIIPLLENNYREISRSDESLTATYTPSWTGAPSEEADVVRDDVREDLQRALTERMEEEYMRRKSVVGPHTDVITFNLANKDASHFASQGQQRSIVLAWKLAEVELVKQTLGTTPVLLLDDVMSELDGSRRDKLVDFVTDDMQTFITATDLSGFNENLLERARVIRL